MKKIVPLKKELIFKSNLAEIVSIALDQNLKLDDRTVKGELLISGSYKMNDTSINTEDFSYNIPVNIEMSDKYILDNMVIDIDDFYYEIINNNALVVNLEIGLNDIEEVEENPIKYEPEVIAKVDAINEKLPRIENNDEINNQSSRIDVKEVKSLFNSLNEYEETYSTYKVCIVKENDTIESIALKYNINKELLEKYNDINDVKIGDKLIIPAVFNETN